MGLYRLIQHPLRDIPLDLDRLCCPLLYPVSLCNFSEGLDLFESRGNRCSHVPTIAWTVRKTIASAKTGAGKPISFTVTHCVFNDMTLFVKSAMAILDKEDILFCLEVIDFCASADLFSSNVLCDLFKDCDVVVCHFQSLSLN